MVKIGYGGSTLELLDLRQTRFGGSKKVGTLRRKASGKTYESPRIILDRHYKDFIGKKFNVYRGRAKNAWQQISYEGNCIVLFFPDKWNEEST